MNEDRTEEVQPKPSRTFEREPEAAGSLDRRQFLGGVGVTMGSLAGGLTGLSTLSGVTGTEGVAEAARIGPRDPIQRRNDAYQVRHKAALDEKNLPVLTHPTNGDEEAFANRIGNFHKTLPHDAVGEVLPEAYDALLAALDSGDIAAIDAVPSNAFFLLPFLNPLGGLSFNMEGPDSQAVGVLPPPSVASAELAAQAAELYWMALLRDVPFAGWDTDPLVQEAADDLSDNFSGYTGPVDPGTGRVTPQVLFRIDYPGVLDGPIVSQFMMHDFFYDGIPVAQRARVPLAGEDFMTHLPEWLDSQNGFALSPPPGVFGAIDPVLRYPRSPRDLGQAAGQDTAFSQYFKAAIILSRFTSFTTGFRLDAGYPYRAFPRQAGFTTFGPTHIYELVAAASKAERHTWYQKWFVHRFLRPEAYGGLVHQHKVGAADYPIHPDLLGSTVLDRIFDYNKQRNQARGLGAVGTYLLPQIFRIGAPIHPSFPAGHAITAGASVTIMKAFWDESAEFPNPKKINADGTALEPYVPNVDGPPLTLGGELNKLAYNISLGRDMSGVHWRVDDVEGNRQGEELAIRILREARATYPEPFEGLSLTKFDGTTITV